MDFRNVQLPREIHTGKGVLNEIPNLCEKLLIPENITIVTGPTTKKIAADYVLDLLVDKGYNVNEIIIKEGTQDTVDKVIEESKDSNAIFGIGGGRVIDVSKMAATNNKIPLISVPTTAAHDGIVSPRASIKNKDGSVSLEVDAPFALIADSEIISQAPYRFLASGYADIISNLTAVEDWKLANKLINDPFSDSAAALATLTAHTLMDQADVIRLGNCVSAEVVVKALISSGIAISIAGNSRPASGSEHKFSHALDIIAPHPALHGEQCGVGTIMMMYLQGGDWRCVRDALIKVNAPVNAKELGIDDEYIIQALLKAHTIRHERYTILGDRGLTYEAAQNIATKTKVI